MSMVRLLCLISVCNIIHSHYFRLRQDIDADQPLSAASAHSVQRAAVRATCLAVITADERLTNASYGL